MFLLQKKKKTSDKDCWYKNAANQGRKLPQCYHCKKFGHVKKNVFKRLGSKPNFHEKNGKENDGNEDKLFITCLAANVEYNGAIWYLDSGYSNHMTGSKKYFVESRDG